MKERRVPTGTRRSRPEPGSGTGSGRRSGTSNIGQFQKDDQLEKRRREQTRKQKQLDKQQRRVKRAAERRMHPGPAVDKDADLAEIIPGPQPGQII